MRPAFSQSSIRSTTFSWKHNFCAVNGKNGLHKMAKFAHNCKAWCKQWSTKAWLSVCFHGSFSCKYLLPSRAKSITANKPSRKRNCSMQFSICVLLSVMRWRRAASTGVSADSWNAGTRPPHNLCINTMARFTKLPNTATSSLLMRSW